MGITATGYQRRTLDVVLTAIQDSLRGKISAKLDLSEREVLGNTSNIDADHIDQLEQLIEEAYNAYDPDNASDDRFVALSLLRGVPRRGAQKGLVTVTLNLDALQSYPPGDLAAHVIDEPTNRWLNRDAVASTSSGSYSAVFQSESAGSAAIAEAGTLTVIASPISGWNSVTNAAAATPGQDIESIPALRIRSELGVSSGGSRTRGAIRSALINIDGVLSAEVYENISSSLDLNGLEAHSLRAVVWDGSPAAAADDAIAQAIYDHKAEGIMSQGLQSGTALDPDTGENVRVPFDRAEASNVTVTVVIQSVTGVSRDDVKAAIIAAMPARVGRSVIFNRLASSVFAVAGVDNRGTFTVNGAGADLAPVQTRIYLLDAGDITVTGDVT